MGTGGLPRPGWVKGALEEEPLNLRFHFEVNRCLFVCFNFFNCSIVDLENSLVALMVKKLPSMQETQI